METGEKLDIAIVTMQFPVASETFISARLRTLVEMGHAPRVYALRRPAPGARQLAEERSVADIPTCHNSVRRSLIGLAGALRRPRLLAQSLAWVWRNSDHAGHLLRALTVLPRSFDILGQLEARKADVVHFEWGHYPSVLARLVQSTRPDLVVSISLIAYDLTTRFGGTVDVVRDADVIRTQAGVNVEQITRFTGVKPERIAVVYDGVDVERLRKLSFHATKVHGRVVVAGRLVPAKGVDDVLRVFAAALPAAPFATLHVLGEGGELPRLKRLAKELGIEGAVEFRGHVSHRRVLEELSHAEALLHLSRTERLPNVVKEAMACRCVPITTRTEGIEELVEHGVTGFVVDHGDLASATDLLTKLLTDQLDPTPMRAAGNRFIAANFDHQANVDELVGLWLQARASMRSAARSVSGEK